MERELRVVLLTADRLRHQFVAHELARGVNLVGIVSEAKSPIVSAPERLGADDQAVIDQHFAERDAVERRLLGTVRAFPDTRLLTIASGTVNAPEVLEWVQGLGPDLVVLYGSGIIKPPLLNTYSERMINLHLGLSPYYRGSGTNFWPLVHREPECTGATLHLVAQDVDAGAILAQVRAPVEASDRAHELGTKTIIAGARSLQRVLHLYAAGRLPPQPQDLFRGRVYRNRDFNASAVRAVWQNLERGMMAEYLEDREERCRRFPICEPSECAV